MTIIETNDCKRTILEPTSGLLESFEGTVTLDDCNLSSIPDEIITIESSGDELVQLTIDKDHEETDELTLVYTGFLEMYKSSVKLIITL